jgi:hypothetical protein
MTIRIMIGDARRMKRPLTLLAITILAGTHIAQGYYGQGWSRRYLPRADRNPNYDREDRQYEPGVITPYRHRFDEDYREWRGINRYQQWRYYRPY